MYIEVLKSKIHRAVITEANLNYIGSITFGQDLMDAANLIENEKVRVVCKQWRTAGYVCYYR